LIGGAPAALDTLNELAEALNDDSDFAGTVTASLATKFNTADFNSTFDTRFGLKSTTDLTEGTNLYYTDAKVQALVDSDYVLARSGGGGASVSISPTAPGTPSDGDLWFDNENGVLLIYYDDGDTQQWVSSTSTVPPGFDSAELLGFIDSDYIIARSPPANQVQPAATSSTDTTVYPLFVETASTNTQEIKVDGGLVYNANTNVLTAGGYTTSGAISTTGTGTIASVSSITAYNGSTGAVTIRAGDHADFSGNVTAILPAGTGDANLAAYDRAQTWTALQTFDSAYFNGNVELRGNVAVGTTSDDIFFCDCPASFLDNVTFISNVGLGVASDDIITVSGTMTSSNDITAPNFISTSDRRIKDNIETIGNALEKVLHLRGVEYDKNGKHEIGVVAQEVQEVIPEVVSQANDSIGTLSVSYGNMVGLLIEAMKEQQSQINALTQEINSIKGA